MVEGSKTNVRRAMRKYTDEQREQMVSESHAPGASVREVAIRHGVRPNLLSYWRGLQAGTQHKRLVAKSVTRTATLAAVRVDEASAQDGVIEIDPGSGCIRVRGVIDTVMLREVLAAVR